MSGNIEIAKPVTFFQTNNGSSGSTYAGANNSHFTRVGNTYHDTTEVPNLKQDFGISIRTHISENRDGSLNFDSEY